MDIVAVANILNFVVLHPFVLAYHLVVFVVEMNFDFSHHVVTVIVLVLICHFLTLLPIGSLFVAFLVVVRYFVAVVVVVRHVECFGEVKGMAQGASFIHILTMRGRELVLMRCDIVKNWTPGEIRSGGNRI